MDILSELAELKSYADMIHIGIEKIKQELKEMEQPLPQKKNSVLSQSTIAQIKARRHRQRTQ